MTVALSLYLDLVRFGFSLLVFFAHFSSQKYSGGLLWRAFAFAQPAVIGFFVLSGFVIAYVANMREHDIFSFASSRISRLYSVLIPALILTAVCDYIGWSVAYDHYLDAPLWIGTSNIEFRYLAASFMASNLGIFKYFGLSLIPGTNGPLWSLSYEAIYYAGFASFFYMRNAGRFVVLLCFGVIAGPSIIILAPIWIIGVGTYWMIQNKDISTPLAIFLFVTSLMLFSITGFSNFQPWWEQWVIFDRPVVQDYAAGVAVAINIYSASNLTAVNLGTNIASVSKFRKIIRWIGLMTFPLYLCHRPLLQFVTGFPISPIGTIAESTWIVVVVFTVVIPITFLSERLRNLIRVGLRSYALDQHKVVKSSS